MSIVRSLDAITFCQRRTCLACLLVALTLSSLTALAQKPNSVEQLAPQATTARRINGIVYAKGVHGKLLSDIYLPRAKALSPAIVYIHGGAWKSGDRTQLQDVAMYLANNGYAGMAIDYDLTSRGDRFPVPLRQAEQAVAWLRKHSRQYGIDPKRIAVAGSSAGGELAALVALDSHSTPHSQVQAAIVFNGVLDLSYVGPDADDMVSLYLGGTCIARKQVCEAASPVSQVHAGAPPFFVGHGTADRIVPFSQAEHFITRLREDNVPVTSFVATDAGHTYWKTDRWFQQNMASVLAFLKNVMKSK